MIGYGKRDMTDKERIEEHNNFQKQLNLDFMINSEEDKDSDLLD